MKSFNALQSLGLLLMRAAFGVIFMSHGYPMLAHRTSAAHALFAQHGIPGYFVYVSGVLELFGGGLLLLGLFTRGAALLLAIETVLLMWKVYTPQAAESISAVRSRSWLSNRVFSMAITA